MSIEIIPFERFLISFITAVFVIYLMFHWHLPYRKACYAIVRMLIQLMLIGYALIMIFDASSSWMTLGVLTLMVLASSWISLNTLSTNSENGVRRRHLFPLSLAAILVGGGTTLILVTQFVLVLDPWYLPRYTIPLAGMIFATSMTSISLAGERLQSELMQGKLYDQARTIAFNTAMIPIINSMFAVGLVSLPGMMTGQILSGVSPFIAARYQIMVMCMLFSASGISSVIFLALVRKYFEKTEKA
jgi:putative ABC transport system permease protein